MVDARSDYLATLSEGQVTGRPPMPLDTIYFMQYWYVLSDAGMKDALYEIESMRSFARLALDDDALPDQTTILKFRRLLETHHQCGKLLEAVNAHRNQGFVALRRACGCHDYPGTVLDQERQTRSAMHQMTKGSQYFRHKGTHRRRHGFGSGATVTTSPANTADVTQVEHLFREIKRQFGDTKVHYRGLAKNIGQVLTLFALSNMWMLRRRLLAMARTKRAEGCMSFSVVPQRHLYFRHTPQ
jgi:IS5 family transposase